MYYVICGYSLLSIKITFKTKEIIFQQKTRFNLNYIYYL